MHNFSLILICFFSKVLEIFYIYVHWRIHFSFFIVPKITEGSVSSRAMVPELFTLLLQFSHYSCQAPSYGNVLTRPHTTKGSVSRCVVALDCVYVCKCTKLLLLIWIVFCFSWFTCVWGCKSVCISLFMYLLWTCMAIVKSIRCGMAWLKSEKNKHCPVITQWGIHHDFFPENTRCNISWLWLIYWGLQHMLRYFLIIWQPVMY